MADGREIAAPGNGLAVISPQFEKTMNYCATRGPL
jgi:hypothetical protein